MNRRNCEQVKLACAHSTLISCLQLQSVEIQARGAIDLEWAQWAFCDYITVVKPTFLLTCWELQVRRELSDFATQLTGIGCLAARRVKILMLQEAEKNPMVRMQRMVIEEEERDRGRNLTRELIERVRVLEPHHQFLVTFTTSCLRLHQQQENERAAAIGLVWHETEVRQEMENEQAEAVAIWEFFRYQRPLEDLSFLLNVTQTLGVPLSEIYSVHRVNFPWCPIKRNLLDVLLIVPFVYCLCRLKCIIFFKRGRNRKGKHKGKRQKDGERFQFTASAGCHPCGVFDLRNHRRRKKPVGCQQLQGQPFW